MLSLTLLVARDISSPDGRTCERPTSGTTEVFGPALRFDKPHHVRHEEVDETYGARAFLYKRFFRQNG